MLFPDWVNKRIILKANNNYPTATITDDGFILVWSGACMGTCVLWLNDNMITDCKSMDGYSDVDSNFIPVRKGDQLKITTWKGGNTFTWDAQVTFLPYKR